MKILAALKKIKHLTRKIEKANRNIGKWCSYIVDNENDPEPTYDGADIHKMHQQINDWAHQIAVIRSAMHTTNVRIKTEFQGRECSIDELLLFQNIVLPAKMKALTSMRRKEKGSGFGRGSDKKDSWVEMQFDPKERDMQIEKLEKTMDELDELLDRLNIETDVVGLDEAAAG